MSDDPDWQTGEIMAENSIHLTSGFHGSSDEQIHLHIDNINRTTLQEEDYVPDEKKINQSNNPKNRTQVIDIEDQIEIFPNPTTGTFIIANKMKQSIKSI
ncbi:MAG: hypothetical protein JXR68_12005 [Bacteroidales bacterium]|nr:hypothetical protein [Bacteroidales bacterium]